MAANDDEDGLTKRAKVAIARISAGAEGFQSAVAARGLDLARNSDVVLFVVRGVINSKHIPAHMEIDVAVAILLALFAAAGAGPLTPAVEQGTRAAVEGMRDIVRAYRPTWWTPHWLARG